MADNYLIAEKTLQNLAFLIKSKSNMDTSIPVSFELLGDKLTSLENGIYKQLTEGNFTETELTLNIQTLRPYMFYNSQGLNKLELINSNLILASGVFKDSTITELVLGGLDSSVTSIPEEFFRNSSITSVYIPQAEQITRIKEWGFCKTNATNWADFSSLKYIEDSAFYGARLENFLLLQTVQEIGDNAFRGAKIYGEKDVGVQLWLTNLKIIGDHAFDHATLYKKDGVSKGTIAINAQDLQIGDQAFLNFTCGEFWINSTTFKSIGPNAFRACHADLLYYDDFVQDPLRFYKLANLDLANNSSSIFSISNNMQASYSSDFIYHDANFYRDVLEITEIIFKPYTFANFQKKTTSLFTQEDYDTVITLIFWELNPSDGITKEIQKSAFGYATIEEIYLSKIETIGEKAFSKAMLAEYNESTTKTIQLGSLQNPVKSIALDAFEGLRTNTKIDETTGEEIFVIEQLIINVYYDNRDYSKIGYPSDYMYGEDGKPLTTEDAPLWGISGDLAGITTVVWNKAFPDEVE